jgi:uncharacterized protein YjbI with pentapeptide repeats
MSNTDGTCEYVLDPDDPETWGGERGGTCYVDEEVLNEEGVWACPHDTEEGDDLCIFHTPVDEKDSQEVLIAFLNKIKYTGVNIDDLTKANEIPKHRVNQFIGAKFQDFDLNQHISGSTLEGDYIDLSHAKINGDFNFSGLEIDVLHLRCPKMTITGDTTFHRAKISGIVQFVRTEFEGLAYFHYAKFKQNIDFQHAIFRKNSSFLSSNFNNDAYFKDAKFNHETTFSSAIFSEDVMFAGARFKHVSFSNSRFKKDANFNRCMFRSESDFLGAKFEGHTSFSSGVFNGEVRFSRAKFNSSVRFSDTTFQSDVSFNNSEFGSSTSFMCSDFKANVDFSDNNIEYTKFNESNLTDANLINANICNSDLESALLSRATLFNADLRGARYAGAVLGDVRIDEDTKFLGHPSDDSNTSPHTFSAIRSQPTCVYDPDYEEDNEHEDVDKAKSVYRALEELGGKHARPRLKARSFVRRQDLQKGITGMMRQQTTPRLNNDS